MMTNNKIPVTTLGAFTIHQALSCAIYRLLLLPSLHCLQDSDSQRPVPSPSLPMHEAVLIICLLVRRLKGFQQFHKILFVLRNHIFKPIPCGWSGIFGCFQSCHYKQCYNGYLCIYLVSQMWTTFVGYILKHMEMLDCHLFQFLKILANGPYIGVNEFTLPQAMHVLQSPPPASQFSSNNCNPLLMPIMMLDAVLNGLHTLSHLILTKP